MDTVRTTTESSSGPWIDACEIMCIAAPGLGWLMANLINPVPF